MTARSLMPALEKQRHTDFEFKDSLIKMEIPSSQPTQWNLVSKKDENCQWKKPHNDKYQGISNSSAVALLYQGNQQLFIELSTHSTREYPWLVR